MSEHDEQCRLFAWAAWQALEWPELDLLFAIPNGGHRHKATAARMKAEGVKAGVPDCFLAVPAQGYHGLFVEMKAGKNRTTKKQKKWIKDLQAQGYAAEVCYGADAAQRAIADYLGYTWHG